MWSALEFIERGPFDADRYIIVGDGIVGYEVADAVIEKNKKAIIIGNDPREQTATLGVARWHFMEKRFAEKGVMLVRHSTVQSIDADGLTVKDKEGAQRRIAIDESFECVLACGYKPAPPEELQKFQGK